MNWNNVKSQDCRCVIQYDITEHSGCCFYVRASGECAFVCKCVTHTKELRAAWPSWCCCHADMEPSESPGELKPCREEISALLREYSVKKKKKKQPRTLRTHSHFSYNTVCHWERLLSVWEGGERVQTHQQDCRRWSCLSRPGPVGVSWGWWQTRLE